MNVNLNTNAGANWNVSLDALKAAGAPENIKGASFNPETRALTLSINEGGEIRSVSLAIPDLDVPAAADDSKIASFCAKIGSSNLMNLSPAQVETICKEVTNELKAYSESLAAGGAPGVDVSGFSKAVMFDIYALMSLLVECGQKMRDAAREVRQAENEQVQASIQAQADQQHSAALTGLIASIAVCVIQVGMQAINLHRLGKGVDQQKLARNDSGIEQAKSDLKLAERATSEPDALKRHNEIASKLQVGDEKAVRAKFNDTIKTEATLEKDADIQSRIDSNSAKLQKLEAIKTGSEGKPGRELTASEVKEYGELKKSVEADQKILEKPYDDRVKLYRSQIKTELNQIRNDPDMPVRQKAYAEAYAAYKLSHYSTGAQIESDLAIAQGEYNQANSLLQHNAIYLEGVQLESSSRVYGDMIMAIGNVAQGSISSITDMLRSKATEMGGEQQVSQEMLDQAKDLFAQCQSLIDSVIQLMQAVLQAEVQSMRDAIQA